MAPKNKVLVGMSGGVDSSAAALLLLEQGCEVAGATFLLFGEAAGEKAAAEAEKICNALTIPHYTLDYKELFEEAVIGAFVSGYRQGETPNPCVCCNRRVKFPAFLASARELGYTHIATGHYARLEQDARAGIYRLRRARDSAKDQSYVLYNLTQELMGQTLFPLGGLRKAEVRELLRQRGLPAAEKAESQDICFVPDGDYCGFLERYTGGKSEPGDFLDLSGAVLGRHRGIWHYTVGQRKGLGMSFGRPMFVAAIDSAANTVTLAEDRDLYAASLRAAQMNYLQGREPEGAFAATVRIRYSHSGAAAMVRPLGDGEALIEFERPQRAITKGQSAVLYDGEYLLGGGIIQEIS